MNKSIYKNLSIFSFFSIFVFANLYFFRSPTLIIPGLPRIVWEVVSSIIFGAILYTFSVSYPVVNRVNKIPFHWNLTAMVVSLIFAGVLVIFSRIEITANSLTETTFQIRAADGDLQDVFIENVDFEGLPVQLKQQCQGSGNIKWDTIHPVLESDSPSGKITCIFYPAIIGPIYGSRFDVTFREHARGGEAILAVNGVETRQVVHPSNYQGNLIHVTRSIPWTPGIIISKIIEFLDYSLIIFVFIIFGPLSIRQIFSDIKVQFRNPPSWRSLFLLTIANIFGYVFFAWIFTITKPSFLSAVSFSEKFGAFFVSGSFISLLTFSSMGALLLLGKIPLFNKFHSFFSSAAQVFPAFFLSALSFHLIDNFSYTTFNQGVATSEGPQRVFYGLLLIFIFLHIYPICGNYCHSIETRIRGLRWGRFLLPAIIVVLISTLAIISIQHISISQSQVAYTVTGNKKLPDIILITGDGINADQTSIYEGTVDTTPHLRQIAPDSLIAENAFPNAGNTAGSTISIYTGKYPTQTRLLYPPDILRGEDSYQHLPGILKSLGYFTIEYGAPHNADAYDLNLLSGFDVANGRSTQNSFLFNNLNTLFPSSDVYMVYEIGNRIFNRLGHILFISKMANDQALVEGKAQSYDDESKITGLFEVLSKSNAPVFAHIHWMGTHADRSTSEFEIDEHANDENIMRFDDGVGKIIDQLQISGDFNNTLLIVGSDHGRMYFTTKRIPLLMRFPGGDHAGKIYSNVQNLDIAPTILDYLGIQKPYWMMGNSILNGEPDNRLIFGAGVPNEIRDTGFVAKEYMKPPFFQFGYISVVYCSDWYRFSFENYSFSSGKISDYKGDCSSKYRIPNDEIFEEMKAHLTKFHFDVSKMEFKEDEDYSTE